MSASHWFSKSYTEAKKRFHESVNQLESLGHQVQRDSLSLDLVGPDGEDLTIDIAVLGSLTSNKLLLYTSGIHGVEGFAGSAIQLSVIDMLKNQKLIEDYCIIFVHIINPFGMAWHRRVNENNVDMLTMDGSRLCEWLRGMFIIPYSGKAGSGFSTLR